MVLQPRSVDLIIAQHLSGWASVEGNVRWRHPVRSLTGSGSSGRATRSRPSTSGKAISGGWWAWAASCRACRAADDEEDVAVSAFVRCRPRTIAVSRMEGYTTEEIAAKLRRTPRTVERKLDLIRRRGTA